MLVMMVDKGFTMVKDGYNQGVIIGTNAHKDGG